MLLPGSLDEAPDFDTAELDDTVAAAAASFFASVSFDLIFAISAAEVAIFLFNRLIPPPDTTLAMTDADTKAFLILSLSGLTIADDDGL